MFYSKTAKQAGGACFFFDDDNNVPADAIRVKEADVNFVINLPEGATFDFSDAGVLNVIPAPAKSTDTVRSEIIYRVWGKIKAERDRRKAGGVKVGAKWFHSDDASRIQQMGLVMMGAGIPAGLQWKTLDGSFVTMTQAVAQSVFAASTASDQAIFAVAEGHRVAMEASADPASYDYSGGWPKIYGE